ncbi:cysteine ABC transporter substrate-binding protein [Burkholderia aenigmatica]|uniref:Cysteine ABC transporter substrate-binding protein n=1 Tax=Burkholderia aenigmatica TaxID=2015348 RepID=A0A6P2H2C6_9BURK|nr:MULTISPECIES: transporter substrate-binding domain-containing protein [Burkholderia]MDN7514940.1 transporter substrate-binding domain-containing protein [Burkholderia sp. AU45251]VWB10366.1 cysteine ABC transporter substrate-binding protein [Burkholderia aenigmatica]HDR9482422.1 transporter substrate-binding domain-containing protein [Burkholderia aenigmatica]HDR9514728.1 transporter substrate-binding domain-containing protein [Burkholderia aenigmatica]HDR9590793.1 transporter substrate-bin
MKVGSMIGKVACVAALLCAAGIAHAGETLDRVKSRGTMVVVTSAKWPPQAYLNDKHEFEGFDIDVANEIGRRLGVKVAFQTPQFNLMTGGHWHGRWDLCVLSVTPTKERERLLDFPAVYYYSPYVFVVHKDSKATSRADLGGKVIGVEAGTTSEDYVNQRLSIGGPDVPAFTYLPQAPKQVKTYGTSLLPYEDLRLGDGKRVDAILTPEQTAMAAIKNGYPVKILPGDYAYREPLAVVADKGDAEWDKTVGNAVTQMKQDGTLTKISVKWFGKDYTK